MNNITKEIVANLVPTFIVSIITSFLTVKLSMRQFYSQKWWEKKSEAYAHIMEQLSYLQYYYGEWFNRELELRHFSLVERNELEAGFRRAKESIAKAAASGAYIVSNETTLALEELLNELAKEDPSGNWIGDIDRCFGKTKECIAVIKELAKKELLNK